MVEDQLVYKRPWVKFSNPFINGLKWRVQAESASKKRKWLKTLNAKEYRAHVNSLSCIIQPVNNLIKEIETLSHTLIV